MFTVMILFCALLVAAFVVAVLMGVIAVSPVLLVIVCLPLIDYFVFKMIFSKRKKK